MLYNPGTFACRERTYFGTFHVGISGHETLVRVRARLTELPLGQAVAPVPREGPGLAVADPVVAFFVRPDAIAVRSARPLLPAQHGEDDARKQED